MSDNYTIRAQNGLAALSDAAAPLYLTLLDKWQGWASAKNENRCYSAAADYDDKIGVTLDRILRHAPFGCAVTDELRDSLCHFFADRWRNNFMASGRNHARAPDRLAA